MFWRIFWTFLGLIRYSHRDLVLFALLCLNQFITGASQVYSSKFYCQAQQSKNSLLQICLSKIWSVLICSVLNLPSVQHYKKESNNTHSFYRLILKCTQSTKIIEERISQVGSLKPMENHPIISLISRQSLMLLCTSTRNLPAWPFFPDPEFSYLFEPSAYRFSQGQEDRHLRHLSHQ